jgi:hypothetical protein
MKLKEMDALLDIVEFYLYNCTIVGNYTDKYAQDLYDDLWDKVHKKDKKKKALNEESL